ncbi:MAG: HNH endonuclease [bacterium]
MTSLYLSKLNSKEKESLVNELHSIQKGKCFICGEDIDLNIHEGNYDIDHVVPLKMKGPDNPNNFALTHSSCNRSKQASDLNVARILKGFEMLRNKLTVENREPNLNDILDQNMGGKYSIKFRIENNYIKYSLPESGKNEVLSERIFEDKLSGFKYFFAVLPIEYIFHDDKINPRSIGANISKLVHEFYLKRPQLHIQLSWIDMTENKIKVKVFDGQHKASAQIMLGVRELPLRVFIDPNIDILLTTNTNAGTTLKQVAFDKSVQRHLGSSLYFERIEQYRIDHEIEDENYNFSERDLLNYFKGESKEVKKYILDSVRDSISHNVDNKLKDYIDFGGRANDKPFSYSTIEKTFYSFYIYQEVLDTPINHKMEVGENPRNLEKEQIMQLMNIIADEIYINKYDSDRGTSQIENKIQKGEDIPLAHLIAYRMAKEEIAYNWLKYILQIAQNFFITTGVPINEKKIFQYKFPEQLWQNITNFIRNFSNLPLWVNKEMSKTIFGGKPNNAYWQTIFETGKSPQNIKVLVEPINLMNLIKGDESENIIGN